MDVLRFIIWGEKRKKMHVKINIWEMHLWTSGRGETMLSLLTQFKM